MVEIIGPFASWIVLCLLLSIIGILIWGLVVQSRRLRSQSSQRDKVIGELQDRLSNEQQKTRLLQFLLVAGDRIQFEADDTGGEEVIELEIPLKYVGHA